MRKKIKSAWYSHQVFDPKRCGYVIAEKVLCGKPNCRCKTKGEKHTAYYLYYRDYNPDGRTRKLRKQYLKKSEVLSKISELSRLKALIIGGCITVKQAKEIHKRFPDPENSQDQILEAIYETVAYTPKAKTVALSGFEQHSGQTDT